MEDIPMDELRKGADFFTVYKSLTLYASSELFMFFARLAVFIFAVWWMHHLIMSSFKRTEMLHQAKYHRWLKEKGMLKEGGDE